MTIRKDAPVLRPDEDPRGSIVQVQVGNRRYDAYFSKKCDTCKHPARMYIEELIVQNYSYPRISAMYSETEYDEGGVTKKFPRVSEDSIRQHFKSGHSPIPTAALRKMAEEKAEQLGGQWEGMVDRYVDPMLTAQAVMQRGYDQIATGNGTPTIAETLAAAKLVHEFESQGEGSVTEEVWREAFTVYFTTARDVMPDELWHKFANRLQSNPLLHALARKLNGEEPQTIEGNVESD